MEAKHPAAYSFLDGHKLGVLSTVSKEGHPNGAAIYYITDERLYFYFLTQTGSTKYQNLHQKPVAALTVVDDYSQTTVQITGDVAVVEVGDEHDQAYQKLAQIHPPGQFAWMPPISKLHSGSTVLMRLIPNKIRMSSFKPADKENPTNIVDVL